MNRRIWISALLLTGCAAPLAIKFYASDTGRLVAVNTTEARWSNEGKYLYFMNGESKAFCRYAIAGSRTKSFNLINQSQYPSNFSISPNGKNVVVEETFIARDESRGYNLYIWNLETKTRRKLYVARNAACSWIQWGTPNAIFFNEGQGAHSFVYKILSTGGNRTKVVTNTLNLGIPASDGTGLLYSDTNGVTHFYDWNRGILHPDARHPLPQFGAARFLGISNGRVVYRWAKTPPGPVQEAYVRRLDTGRTVSITIPDSVIDGSLSPDFRYFWTVRLSSSHFPAIPEKLYVMPIDPATTTRMAAP